MKNWLKNVIYTVTLCALILMMLFFNATSPYQLWDISLKLIDYDKLEVLRTFWMLAVIGNCILAFIAKRHKKIFCILFLILALLSLIKFFTLFFV